MQTPTKGSKEASSQPQPTAGRGAPATFAAHAVRKDVSVRVSVTTSAAEPEELREHGYGHGV